MSPSARFETELRPATGVTIVLMIVALTSFGPVVKAVTAIGEARSVIVRLALPPPVDTVTLCAVSPSSESTYSSASVGPSYAVMSGHVALTAALSPSRISSAVAVASDV